MADHALTKVLVPAYSYEAGPLHGLLSPFEPGTRTLPAGHQVGPRFRPLPVDIVFEKDVAVTLRDGTTITTDVFRPVGDAKVPVLVAWSPYGKSGGTAPKTTGLYDLLGIDNGMLSGLAKFEGPDPAFWCARGYAVCNPDPRGIARSGGDVHMIGRQEAQDASDLIEWLAAQAWCNGRVGMSGTSYLAFSQWFTAAERPPHLAAINPVEGLSDAWRDLVAPGGMPDPAFLQRLQANHVGSGLREDVVEEASRYPLADHPIWQDKVPLFERIDVPAYVVASYSNTLHTAGTFRAWRRMASDQKWLRIHARQEWPDYYDPANQEDIARFFDRFLKGEENGWDDTPRVRYAVHDMHGGDLTHLPAASFPPEGTVNTRFHLDARTRTLSPEAPAQPGEVAYDAEGDPGLASFVLRFDHDTRLVGYPKLSLWVEARGHDDMDLFVLAQKLDAQGTPLQQFTVPARTALLHDLTERGASILRYKGPSGRLRVSARHLDPDLSTDEVPAHSFDRVDKLSPGEIVPVEIDLLPIGMAFRPGEQLRLVVSARNLLGGMMPGTAPFVPGNCGQHVVHTGGERPSYLQLPVLQ